MTYMATAFLRGFGVYNSVRCNMCSTVFPVSGGYFRCEDQRCSYDICLSCGTNLEPVAAVRIVDTTCLSGHRIYGYLNG